MITNNAQSTNARIYWIYYNIISLKLEDENIPKKIKSYKNKTENPFSH
jgi:hypothetical protein